MKEWECGFVSLRRTKGLVSSKGACFCGSWGVEGGIGKDRISGGGVRGWEWNYFSKVQVVEVRYRRWHLAMLQNTQLCEIEVEVRK